MHTSPSPTAGKWMSQAQPAGMSGVLMVSGMQAGSGVSGRCGWRKTSGSCWEVGVLLSSGRKVIFLQNRDAARMMALERRQITSQSIMGSRAPGSCLPFRTPQGEVGGCLSSRGCPSPVPPICELIPQGP